MTEPRVAHCIFCDDIRYEMGNKMSLMGMYSGDILLPSPPPAILPKLAFAVWVISDIDDPPAHIAISVLMPDKTEIFKMESDAPSLRYPEGARKANLQFIFGLSPVPLSQDGYIEVYADTGREKLRAGRLMVKFPQVTDSEAPPVLGPQQTIPS
jgi:hypothetical protein